ncbi:hypothetical protein E2C01_074770 [Portunus trituberculatus]|uniref:Uncharacterized protein n=1 Tax=Portunus trituberculatus TaxID=210409 RepID=A0A5B7IH40_PORTR|nr:hypothetical protein [Portunus trituberculatus]
MVVVVVVVVSETSGGVSETCEGVRIVKALAMNLLTSIDSSQHPVTYIVKPPSPCTINSFSTLTRFRIHSGYYLAILYGFRNGFTNCKTPAPFPIAHLNLPCVTLHLPAHVVSPWGGIRVGGARVPCDVISFSPSRQTLDAC